MEKNTGKVREKSGNFVILEKWEPCQCYPYLNVARIPMCVHHGMPQCHLLVMVGTHMSMSHPYFMPECSLMVAMPQCLSAKKVTTFQGMQH